MGGSTGKRLTGIILFIVAAVGVAAFLFLLFADSEGFDKVPGTGDVPAVAIAAAIILGVIALVLILLLLIRGYDRREDEADSAEAFFIPDDDDFVDFSEVGNEPVRTTADVEPIATPDDDGRLDREGVVPYDLSEVPLGSQSWGTAASKGQSRVHSFNFPREEEKALYNNDYIRINAAGDQLKLRTLLAAPEGTFDGMSDDPIRGPKPAPKQNQLAKQLKERPKAKPAPKPAPKPAAKPRKPAVKPYYDYVGDVDPVIDIEGIGPVYEKKLDALGVKTTARLCYEDADELAKKIDAPAKSVRTWQTMAQFMKVSGIGGQYAEVLARAGVDGIEGLKSRKADDIAGAINNFLDSLEVNVIGTAITPRRVEGWQKKAAPMRRVRQAIPEE